MATSFKVDVNRGIEYRKDGAQFVGSYKLGRPHGLGVLHWPDGERYEGEFLDGVREGLGVYTRADGAVFAGQWRHDMKEGKGKETYRGGNSYLGGWAQSMWQGRGCTVEAAIGCPPKRTTAFFHLNQPVSIDATSEPNEKYFIEVEEIAVAAQGLAQKCIQAADEIMANVPILSDPPKIKLRAMVGQPVIGCADIEVTDNGLVRVKCGDFSQLEALLQQRTYRHNYQGRLWELHVSGCDATLAERYVVTPLLDIVSSWMLPVSVERVLG